MLLNKNCQTLCLFSNNRLFDNKKVHKVKKNMQNTQIFCARHVVKHKKSKISILLFIGLVYCRSIF